MLLQCKSSGLIVKEWRKIGGTTKQSVETAEASQDVEQGDTQTPSSMNAPTPSEGKDTTKSPNPQKNQQKTDEKVEEPQN